MPNILARLSRACLLLPVIAAAVLAMPDQVYAQCTDDPCLSTDLRIPTISINPGTGPYPAGARSVTISWSDNVRLDPSTRQIVWGNQDVTGQFTWSASNTWTATSTGTVIIGPGTTVLDATICDGAGNCWTASASYTSPAATWVSDAPHAGELANVNRWGTRVSYATPAYFTEDKPRSLPLVYMSSTAAVRGLVQVDATDATATPPEQYSVRVQDLSNGSFATLITGTQEVFYQGGAGTTRLAAQFDMGHKQTGAYRYRVLVRKWRGG